MVFILFFRNNVLLLKRKKENKCFMPVRLHLKSLLDERKTPQTVFTKLQQRKTNILIGYTFV